MVPFNIQYRVVRMEAFDDCGEQYRITLQEEGVLPAISQGCATTQRGGQKVPDALPPQTKTLTVSQDNFAQLRLGSVFNLVLNFEMEPEKGALKAYSGPLARV